MLKNADKLKLTGKQRSQLASLLCKIGGFNGV